MMKGVKAMMICLMLGKVCFRKGYEKYADKMMQMQKKMSEIEMKK